MAANWTIATNCKLTFRMDYIRLYLIYTLLLWLKSSILVKSPLEKNCSYSDLVKFSFAGFSSHKVLIWFKYCSLVNSGQYPQAHLHQRSSPFHTLVLYKALSCWNFIECIRSLLWNISLGSNYNKFLSDHNWLFLQMFKRKKKNSLFNYSRRFFFLPMTHAELE